MKQELSPIKTTFLYYDKKNRNGRLYSKKIAEDIVRQFNQMDENGTLVLGALKGNNRTYDLLLNDVSHRIKEIHIDEDNSAIEGTFEVLKTPLGMTLKSMLISKGSFDDLFAISSRGIGTTDEEGRVDTYELLGFDIISKQESTWSVDNKKRINFNFLNSFIVFFHKFLHFFKVVFSFISSINFKK